jgi:hypothetical protein
MRTFFHHRQRLWQAFLRTTSGRQLLRDRVIQRPGVRAQQPIAQGSKLWLILLALLCLLAMVIGAWIGKTTDKQRWLDDDDIQVSASLLTIPCRT